MARRIELDYPNKDGKTKREDYERALSVLKRRKSDYRDIEDKLSEPVLDDEEILVFTSFFDVYTEQLSYSELESYLNLMRLDFSPIDIHFISVMAKVATRKIIEVRNG